MSQVVIQNATTKANTYLPFSPAVVGDITPPVHGQSLAWDGTQSRYDNDVAVWRDLTGVMDLRGGGAGAAFTLTQFDVAGRVYEYATNQGGNGTVSRGYFSYHVPHDIKPNSDTFFHLHISTISSVTTTVAFDVYVGTAKRGGTFPALKKIANVTHTFAGVSDVRKHIVSEVALSTLVGTATTLQNDEIETDGIIQILVENTRGVTVGDNMAGNATGVVFVMFADIHYQSDMGGGTLNKDPPFRT